MTDVQMPHAGHEDHLRFLHNTGFTSEKFAEYKKLIGKAQYVCESCCRGAESSKNPCVPERL